MSYTDIRFDDPIPKGYKIGYKIEVAGIHHRIENTLAFIGGVNHSIELQTEPTNKHDKNAIMVIGKVTITSFFFFKSEKRILLGYVPAEYAAVLAPNEAYKNYLIRQRYAGASERGGKVEFHLLEKKVSKMKSDEGK